MLITETQGTRRRNVFLGGEISFRQGPDDPIPLRVAIFRLGKYDLFVRSYSERLVRGKRGLEACAQILHRDTKTAVGYVEIVDEEERGAKGIVPCRNKGGD